MTSEHEAPQASPRGTMNDRGSISSAGDVLPVNRIQRFCLHDGPGIRTTVFVQGCSLRCWWCQNPDTIPCGGESTRQMTIASLVETCRRDARYWRQSGGGVTVSGGECLLQGKPLAAFLRRLGEEGCHRAVETSGTAPRRRWAAAAPQVDLWLWDLKAVSADRFREHTGGDVRVGLDNLRWVLAETPAEVVLRVPLINGFNADEVELRRMARWVGQSPRPVTVEILPGHEVGCAMAEGRPSPRVAEGEVHRATDIFKEFAVSVLVRW